MSRFIPVEPEKWAEMVLALSEVKRLRAENERLRASSFVTAVPVEDYERLKAEVERLTDSITRGAITPDAKPE